MIYTTKKDICRYFGLSKNLDIALHYLETADLTKLQMGRNEIASDLLSASQKDACFINRFDYLTIEKKQAIWEGHIKYADIHVVISGNELIGVSQACNLVESERIEKDDFIGFTGNVETWFPMDETKILIVFPEDVHLVKVLNVTPSQVQKAVFKVCLSEF